MRRSRIAGAGWPTWPAILLVLAGCAAKETRRAQTISVSAAPVVSRAVPFEIEATGTVEPQQTVEVLAEVQGTIEHVRFDEGAPVRAGQVLFQIDDRPYRSALDQARAVLARDRAQAHQATRDADRARTLRDQNVISAGEFEDKQSVAEGALATVRGDSAAAAQAELNLARTSIRSPIAGRTGRLNFHVGDLVKASDSGSPLVVINRMHPVRVRFTVPQDAMSSVIRGRGSSMSVRVAPADQDSFIKSGRLVFIDNAVDPGTGTLLLKGEFDNRDESLWPGEFVRVRLVLDSDPHAIVVPNVAVTAGPTGAFVYVIAADSSVSVRPVVVKRTQEDIAVVASGLEPGELVVTDGQMRLGPGSRVIIRPAAGTETDSTHHGGDRRAEKTKAAKDAG